MRGNQRRLSALADLVSARRPDLLLLQEVGAGRPSGPQGCQTFLNARPRDLQTMNTALQLAVHLDGLGFTTTAALACRGNVGWKTDPNTFRNRRILRRDRGAYHVVHERGSNPYPQGILTEGLAILFSSKVEILDHQAEHLEINYKGDRFFAQWMAFRVRSNLPEESNRWYLIVNIHGGHKVIHLEQAVALQLALQAYISQNSQWGTFAGAITAGDFNAELYRPETIEARTRESFLLADGEVVTAGWEPTLSGLYDFGSSVSSLDRMKRLLLSLNDSSYKAFASIRDVSELTRRAGDVVFRFDRWIRRASFGMNQMTERIYASERGGACRARPEEEESCGVPNRIDHIFATPSLATERAVVLFPQNDWFRLDTVSDHPGVMADFVRPTPAVVR